MRCRRLYSPVSPSVTERRSSSPWPSRSRTRVTRFLNTCVSWPTSPPPPVGSSTEWSPAALGRHAGETSERAYEQQAHVAGQPCHHKEHAQREARAASPAGLTERLRPWHVHHRRPAERGHPPQGPDDVLAVGAPVVHGAAFAVENVIRHRELRAHQVRRADTGFQDQPTR